MPSSTLLSMTCSRIPNCQQTLNKFIVAKFSSDAQWHVDMNHERQRKKMKQPFSQAQKVVWLFQHAETIMMDLVRDELKAMKKTVLANVHDAIVIRERLSATELNVIEQHVRAKTHVGYNVLNINHVMAEDEEVTEGTKTLSPQELQVKALADKAEQYKQQEKALKARQQMAKAQKNLMKASRMH